MMNKSSTLRKNNFVSMIIHLTHSIFSIFYDFLFFPTILMHASHDFSDYFAYADTCTSRVPIFKYLLFYFVTFVILRRSKKV